MELSKAAKSTRFVAGGHCPAPVALVKLMMSPKWRSQPIALKHEGQTMQTCQPKVR